MKMMFEGILNREQSARQSLRDSLDEYLDIVLDKKSSDFVAIRKSTVDMIRRTLSSGKFDQISTLAEKTTFLRWDS
mgnify:CR=1 FL=1